ncbi:MAG: CZB domain-containing protein [Gallionellaceae bacterium]
MSAKVQAVDFIPLNLSIDFTEVLMQHMEWRERLINHIKGAATDDWASRDATQYDRCDLGRWLRSEGHSQLGHLPAFRRLEIVHAEFHYYAGAILAKTLLKEVAQADEMLRNEFSQATRRMLVAVNELNELAGKTHQPV